MALRPLSRDAHRLLVRPENHSLLLGLAHHALFRPANALARRTTGHALPGAIDPRNWGAAAARLAERLDYELAPKGSKIFRRREDIKLDAKQLEALGTHLRNVHGTGRTKKVEREFRDLIENSYNHRETIRSLIAQGRRNPNFAATLHGVEIPSLTGEWGKHVKNVTTDVAAIIGAGEIVNLLSEKKSAMTVSEHLQRAAAILEAIPAKEAALQYVGQLKDAGIISEAEEAKHARIFEETYQRNPEDAEAIFQGMVRGQEVKGASLGEAVIPEGTSAQRISKFDQICLEGLGIRA